MTRRLPYWCVHFTPASLKQGWRLSLLVAAILWMVTLPACQAQSIPPKALPHTTAAGAEKIDVNLLRLDADVRRGGKRLDTAAAEMGMKTVSGHLRLDVIVQPLDASIVRKIQLPGVLVHHVSLRYQRVSVVIVDLALLYDLAQIPEVRMILPEYSATTSRGAGNHALQPGDTPHVR